MNKTKIDELWSDLQTKFGVSLDDCNQAILQSVFHPRTMKKNDFFIREGEQSTEIGFIIKGAFRSFYIDEQGNDVTKYFHVEGGLLLSYLAYISKKESTYNELIAYSLQKAKELGYGAVAITGNLEYYHTFGFKSGWEFHIYYADLPRTSPKEKKLFK